jgi:hypothetical protein
VSTTKPSAFTSKSRIPCSAFHVQKKVPVGSAKLLGSCYYLCRSSGRALRIYTRDMNYLMQEELVLTGP